MKLETIIGDLRAYQALEPGTFQHVDQLMNARRDSVQLQNNQFYTADGQGYFPQGEDVEWAITRLPDNLVLRHLDDAFRKLTAGGNYHPGNAEAQAARSAPDTILIKMSQLRLSGDDKEWCYLSIQTEDGRIATEQGYQAPNEEEQKAMDRLGYTSENLTMLHDLSQKIEETRIYVLNPAYVLEEVGKDQENDSLWRASWLGSFGGNSLFLALDRSVNLHGRLRGVRRVEAARSADAPENGVVPSVPSGPQEMRRAAIDDVLQFSRDYVAPKVWEEYETGIRQRLNPK